MKCVYTRVTQGKLTAANMKQRLGAFYRNLPAKEIKLLLGDGPFTKETLRGLLASNDLGSYDPAKEAFKAYDPNGTGYVDTDTLRSARGPAIPRINVHTRSRH